MPNPVPDQAPPSPFEILGLNEEETPDEAQILDAYAHRARSAGSELELSTTFQWAKVMALYVLAWQRDILEMPDERDIEAPRSSQALSAEELAEQMGQRTPIDLDRFRRTPRRILRAAVEQCIWHRSAWNDLVRDQPTEVVAGLLAVRAELLALADEAEQLLYELESEGIADATKRSFLVQRAATSALAYLAWVLPDRAGRLGQSLVHNVPDETQGMVVPNTVLLAQLALDMPRAQFLTREERGGQTLDQRANQAMDMFVELLHKAPLLSHELSAPLLRRVAAQIAEQPGLFYTTLFHGSPRTFSEPDSLGPDWRDFNPSRQVLLSRYITLAFAHLALPIVPVWSLKMMDFDDLLRRAHLAYVWISKKSPLVTSHTKRRILALTLAVLALAATSAAGFLPWNWAGAGAGALAGVIGASLFHAKLQVSHSAKIAVTALTAMQTRIPTSLLVEQAGAAATENGIHPAWLPPQILPDDPLALAMEAWDGLVTLVARWAPEETLEDLVDESSRNETDRPPADHINESSHQD